jgi:hypothetical protein
MSFAGAFFNRLKPSATQVYLAQETSLIKFGINGKGSIFFIELGTHFGGGVSLPLVFFSLKVRKRPQYYCIEQARKE